jgi:cytochrome d ubiquinol oxidase subunit I
MGKTVAADQPTKFALMEGAQTTTQNPLVAFLAYGDPQHSIPGLDDFKKACEGNTGKTLGQLVSSIIPNLNTGPASSVDLGEMCVSDLTEAGTAMAIVNSGYIAKITLGVIAVVSLVALVTVCFSLGPLSNLTTAIFASLGRKRTVLLLSLLVLSACILTASLGWFVREVGRKPWTVYGLLYPEELVTPVPINPVVLAFFVLTFVIVAIVGVYGMYVVATSPLRFIQLLKKGAGVE